MRAEEEDLFACAAVDGRVALFELRSCESTASTVKRAEGRRRKEWEREKKKTDVLVRP